MLTSGSTGNVKAVSLSNSQILTALRGKIAFHGTQEGDTFLNWINLDHVANLTEIHLHAMYLGCDQIHVPASTIIQSPLLFLQLLSKHKVAYTFAPNFLLFYLEEALAGTTKLQDLSIDLSHLRSLISGGEANVVGTCASLSQKLERLGSRNNVICPGFGMTETCAGSIYNKTFPEVDVLQDREFASLGRCIPGIELRVTAPDDNQRRAGVAEEGQLEVSGPLVFKKYFNDPAATSAAFTEDGWFRTGDLAFVDARGDLNLSGRTKELMNINGVKYAPQALENAIAEAAIPGITPSFTVVFSYRLNNSPTERVCVVYLPSYSQTDCMARAATNDAICRAVMLCIGSRPYVLPLTESQLQKSTLGKLSRTKIQANFIDGRYKLEQRLNELELQLYHSATVEAPSDELEELLMCECMDQFGFTSEDMGVETNILDLGVDSIELLRWKKRLQERLEISDIPVVTIITNPTIRQLAAALRELQKPQEYNPLIVLQSQGSGTPLWLVHPGIGEILVFIGLAKYFTDRPVYALRAKGFDGQKHFQSIPEVLEIYHDVIKKKQPNGPYAIAGYSYGTLLAFELTKRMTQSGDTIKFLGAFNLAPHVKWRMRQLDWVEALLNLSHFLQLLEPDFAMSLSPELRKMKSREEMLSRVISLSAPGRLPELGLTKKKFHEWVDVAMNLHDIARDYDPSGMVEGIDVFVATPLIAVAKTREEWMEKHLRFWADFSATPPRFHSVQGEHYTMLGPDNIHSFQKTLKAALSSRGV
jgi:thioesterase domain-containing protein/aryl carrier-like protein